ncbi:MAG TPA: secretin N-terminal domain-containing protein [Candidatus Elarobacter sp.]|nr:secretin N-terminal domain-containing protein [Candidatus Elarobacter sp.]
MRIALRRLFACIAVITLSASALASSPLRAAPQPALQRMSLRFSGVPVRDALVRIARAYGARIAVAPDVRGRVTASIERATLDQALADVLTPLGASWSRVNHIVVVTLRSAGPPSPTASPNAPAVLQLQVVGAARAAGVLRGLYPHDRIAVDASANALVVVAPPDDVTAMRAVVAGIDVRDPMRPVSDAVQLRNADPQAVAAQLRHIYPSARLTVAPNRTLLVEARPADLTQIKALVAALDTPPATAAPSSAPVDAVRVARASPRDVARAIANQFRDVRAGVAGQSVVLGGAPDDVAKAKALIALIDQPASGVRFTQIYRLHFVDARSVANLLSRSFHDATIGVDADLNAISALATPSEQQRIADALGQLDTSGAGGAPPLQQPGSVEPAGGGAEVISLRAAAPGLNGAPSSSASDIATTVTQALQGQASDLHITVPPNGTQLILTGSPYAIRLAKGLIAQLDVEQKLVVLDTEILELDENAAKNLGLSFSTPVITTTVNETTPNAPDGGTPPPFLQFQPLTRSPVSFGLSLNLLLQSGKGRVLADPRITTISGRTASIRAGDNIAILTTTGGGTGTVATTQLQTFQTGVTLDITPVVNAGNFITVSLHPTVNSLSGVSNGIPQISTRDTQTTVAMREGQTLVIGGLIQDTTTTTSTKIPVLGDLPLIGKAFRNDTYNRERNELIITVTPHVVTPETAWIAEAGLPPIPSEQPLPTLPPSATLPPAAKASPPTLPPAPRSTALPARTPLSQPTIAATHAASPAPVPSAFSATNVFTFGQPPSNNFAGPADPVQIFYATFSPTVLRNGTPVSFTAVTTTNVSRLTIGYHGFQTQIAQSTPGQWQSSYNFSSAGLTPGQAGVSLTVTATRLDGASSSMQIPVSVVP